jgi:hypothetical protein
MGNREEIDLAQPGRSYGWPCYEGADPTPGYQDLAGCAAQYAAGPGAHQPPAYEYPHMGSVAIVAGPRYWTARAAANATDVTGPASPPASSSSTLAAGAAPLPTEKTKPPETGCESAEITR